MIPPAVKVDRIEGTEDAMVEGGIYAHSHISRGTNSGIRSEWHEYSIPMSWEPRVEEHEMAVQRCLIWETSSRET